MKNTAASANNLFSKKYITWLSGLTFVIAISVGAFATPSMAALEYGQAYSDIGTFSNVWGKWTLWVGWDANFSETYNPEGESYAWVVYFAPEAIYLALQSGKSVYSGVNINAGFKHFYGMMSITGGDRVSKTMLKDELRSVGLSKNLFEVSAPGIGVGPFNLLNLSFAVSAGITFLKEKNTDTIKRGIQLDSGVSVSYDLISNPLPFSVSLGTDCEAGDPPELCQFIGFYPIVIWNVDQSDSENPIDLIVSELEKTASTPPPKPVEEVTKKILVEVMRILQSNAKLREFIESAAHNSNYDNLINETQQWLQSGDTSNLPENLQLPNPAVAFKTMKPIFAATQMAFELGYQRGCNANPSCTRVYADCVIEEYCKPGEECVIEISADEIAALFPDKSAADFENAWLLIDNSIEQYLVSESETTEWLQIINGKATYKFKQNTETSVVLGVKIDPGWAPIDVWVELCRRMVHFTGQPSAMPWVPLLFLND